MRSLYKGRVHVHVRLQGNPLIIAMFDDVVTCKVNGDGGNEECAPSTAGWSGRTLGGQSFSVKVLAMDAEKARLSIDVPTLECPPREGLFPEEEQFHNPTLSSYVVQGRCDELGIEGYHRNAGEHGLGNENNRKWCSGSAKISYDYTISPSHDRKLCFNVWGGIRVNGNINLFHCNNAYTNDKWELTGDSTLRLKHKRELCMAPEHLAAGARVKTQVCSAATILQVEVAQGQIRMKSNPELCMSVQVGAQYGSGVSLMPCSLAAKLEVDVPPACTATFSEMDGINVATVRVDGTSDSDLDSACCEQCSARGLCAFWVRESGSSGQKRCWLKRDAGRQTDRSDRRGGYAAKAAKSFCQATVKAPQCAEGEAELLYVKSNLKMLGCSFDHYAQYQCRGGRNATKTITTTTGTTTTSTTTTLSGLSIREVGGKGCLKSRGGSRLLEKGATSGCAKFLVLGKQFRSEDVSGQCLDYFANRGWGLWECHGGHNQQLQPQGAQWCVGQNCVEASTSTASTTTTATTWTGTTTTTTTTPYSANVRLAVKYVPADHANSFKAMTAFIAMAVNYACVLQF